VQYRFDKHSILDILLPFIFVVCVLGIQLFNHHIHKTVWKDYRILFIHYNEDVSGIMQEIRKSGIKDAISVESIAERFFSDDERYPQFTQQEQYLQWFENKNDNLSYIYIPKTSYIPLSLLKSLHDRGIHFYVEENPYPKIVNLFTVSLLSIALLCFSSKRLLFLFSILPYLLVSPLVNGIIILTSILIFTIATFYAIEILFCTSNIDIRHKRERLKGNIVFFTLFLLAFFLLFFDTFLSFIYVILSFFADMCSLYIIGKFQHLSEKEKDSKRIHEKPILYSLNSNLTKQLMSAKKNIAVSFILLICYTIPIVFLSFFLLPLNKTDNNKLSLPAPSNKLRYKDFSSNSFLAMTKHKSQEVMPDLTHYICDEWARKFDKTIPLSQINFINNDFIMECLKNIKEDSIERLLLSEEGFVSTFYTFKFFKIERLQLVQLVISLLSIFTSLAIMLFKSVC